MDRLLLRIDEAAKLLGLGRSKAYQMAASGELPTVKIGTRSTRVPAEALQEWVKAMVSTTQRREQVRREESRNTAAEGRGAHAGY